MNWMSVIVGLCLVGLTGALGFAVGACVARVAIAAKQGPGRDGER